MGNASRSMYYQIGWIKLPLEAIFNSLSRDWQL